MKYKVGQKVRLHPLSYYKNNPGFKVHPYITARDDYSVIVSCLVFPEYTIIKSMKLLLGETFIIEKVNEGQGRESYYTLNSFSYYFPEWMVESPLEQLLCFFKKVEDEV